MANETKTSPKGPIQIDVGNVLRSRGVRLSRWIVRMIERLIRQEELNRLLVAAYPRRGADFCRTVVSELGISVEICHAERLPEASDRRKIFVSNHPLGGLDGMVLIDFVRQRYGCEPRFVVNDLLMAVEPLSDVFLPINKHGGQSRESAAAIDEALASDVPVIIFPAGLCSRKRNGRVADLEWRKMAVQKARESGRQIVPLGFVAQNSPRFYRLARLRERLGIKFNIEMILLPAEMFRAARKTFKIVCGTPVDAAALGDDARSATAQLRGIVDNLLNTPTLKQ